MNNFVKSEVVLKKIFSKLGISKELVDLYSVWEKILGSKLAKKIQLCGVKDDVLLVKVETSAHHHYLKLNKKILIEKINKTMFSDESKVKYNDIKVVKL
jgi:hypothetical protein